MFSYTTLLAAALLGLVGVGSGHDSPPEEGAPLPQTPLDLFRAQAESGLLAVYDMTNWFLEDAVQPRTIDYLPENGITWEMISESPEDLADEWQTLTSYWVGYVVIICVSVLTFLGMFFAACLVPCCRCCSCCGGGQRRPRDRKRDKERSCYRGCCCAWLLIFLCACALGAAAMMALSGEMRKSLTGSSSVFKQVSTGADQIQPFLAETMTQVNQTVYGGAVQTTDAVFGVLGGVPQEAIDAINEATGLDQTYQQLEAFSDNLDEINSTLADAHVRAEELYADVTILDPELATAKINITAALGSCDTSGCNDTRAEVNTLGVGLNATMIEVAVRTLYTAVNQALDAGFTDQVDLVGDEIERITYNVTSEIEEQLVSAREDVDRVLEDEVLAEINRIDEKIHKINFDVVSETMDDAQTTIKDNNVDLYVYWTFVGMATVVCIVVALAFIGSLHIFCSPRQAKDDDCCHVDRATGSHWLFAAIGFIFVFYWLLTLITMAMFLGGGMSHTEACRYVVQYDNPDFKDARKTINDIVINAVGSDTDIDIANWNVTFFEAYNDCRHDKALYTALRLPDNGFDLRKLLDISAVENAIEELKGTPIDIPDVDFLSDELADLLNGLDEAFSQVNINVVLDELRKNVTTPADLNTLADNLAAVVTEPGVDGPTLEMQITYLRVLYTTSQEAEVTKQALYNDMYKVNQMMGGISFSAILDSLNTSQQVINNDGDAIVGGIVNSTADESFEAFETFIDDTIYAVENDIAQCFPLYNATATVVNAGCVTGLYPINGMAFSLGWNLFFLLLVLIFAFKVADHFRRTVGPSPADQRPLTYAMDDTDVETLPLPGGTRYTQGMPPQVNPAYLADHGAYPAHGMPYDGASPYKYSPGPYTPHYSPPPRYSASAAGGAKVMVSDDPSPDYC